MIRTVCVLLCSFMMISLPSQAEAVSDASIIGSWQFSADTNDTCTFTGNMTLSSHEEKDTFGCELTARQACPGVTYVVRQSCTAFRSGDQLSIVSKIEEFLEGPVTSSYWPDNFSLSIVSGSFMSGALISHGTHPAEFWRPEGQLF